MDDLKNFCCVNKNCPKRGIRSEDNIRLRMLYGKNNDIRLLYCLVCKKRFSERQGTPLFDSRLPQKQVVSIVEHLVEGNGLRKTGRLTGADDRIAGEHAEQLYDELVAVSSQDRGDSVRREWDFVKKKQKNCDENNPADARCGDHWDHVALDAKHKLVLEVVNGKRTEANTELLVRKTAKRLEFRVPRLMTSDEYNRNTNGSRSANGCSSRRRCRRFERNRD